MTDHRAKIRATLNPLFLNGYDALCNLLGKEWQPYFGYRSIEEQDKLYAQGRTAPGEIVTKAEGASSAHCYGCAVDFTMIDDKGNFIWLKDEDPRIAEFTTAVWRAGLRSGELYHDPLHAELKISCTFHDVAAIFKANGLDAAMAYIKTKMI